MTALEIIKSRLAKRETLYLIIHDDEAKRVLAAWLVYGQRCQDFVPKGVEKDEGILRRLWASGAPVDHQRLGELANVPASRCQRVFGRLAAAGLLWPDGTIDEQAARLLRSESIAYVQGMLPKGARPSNPVKEPS